MEYFRIGNRIEKQTAAQKILTHPDLVTLPEQIVVAAFRQSGNDAEKQAAAQKILTHTDLVTLSEHIVLAAFRQPGNEAEKQAAVQKILTHPDLITLQHDIVVAAFRQSGNEAEKQAAAQKILTHPDTVTLQPEIVVAAFRQSGNEAEKHAAAQKILTHPDMVTLPYSIVVAAFRQSGNEVKKQAAAQKILTHPDLVTHQPDIVIAAFHQSGNEAEKQAAAQKILTHSDIETLQHDIVVAAFRQSGNETEKQAAAKKILLNPYWNKLKNLFPVLEALKLCSMSVPIHDFVRERIKKIIDSYLGNSKLRINRDFYFGLMKIPFHQDKLWKVKSKYIIFHWNKVDRRGISNVLLCYISYPTSISRVCRSILENWKTEIALPIYQIYGKPHYGDHIRIALGHPDLRDLAKKTANEIIKKNKSIALSDDLIEIVEKIVKEGIYPEWISDKSEENLS
jgi:DNA gyrase inhibitor GyrI